MSVPGLDPRPGPPPPTLRSAEPSRTPLDALVIGAGQAGLAVGHHLARHRMRFLLVDAAPEIGHTWSTRWDSLRLFTPAEYDGLPGMAFPAAPGSYPTKGQVADYLKAYAARFDLPVMLNTRVEHVDRTDTGEGLFRVTTSQGTLWARQVVVATGPFQRPHVPSVGADFAPQVDQRHSSAYRSPSDLPGGKVLVVGAGNSGLQIALELAATHEVHLAVGTRQRTVGQRPLGRDLFWWLTRTGLLTRPATSPLVRLFRKRGGDLVIGTSWDDVDAAGITVHPRLTTAHGQTAGLGGSALDDVAAVVWATGFRPDYPWLHLPDVWDGARVDHERGRTRVPGLWFIGLPWQHTRGSALLGFVGDDAAWIAAKVVDRFFAHQARP
ncbi:MAG TPA: NAD(P)/FAD-dependent oxidoreductase [Nocardioides sp.]|nr:NAD(P)/FAD-dependent oxidoreductase [Nocardioides sp.]